MAGKRNKIRYTREEKSRPEIMFTGRVFLMHRDEDEMEQAAKGDMLAHASVEALNTYQQGEYDRTGYAGYFRFDIHDGRAWQPVQLSTLFPDREHYFSKTECPIDVYEYCAELLSARTGLRLKRTYREHYEVEED